MLFFKKHSENFKLWLKLIIDKINKNTLRLMEDKVIPGLLLRSESKTKLNKQQKRWEKRDTI